MKSFVGRWATTALAVLVAAPVVGIKYDGLGCLLAAALLLGVVNAFVRPILLLLSLPLVLLSFGLFILFINGALLYLVGYLLPCFQVGSFGSAFFGSILISIISWLVGGFFKANQVRVDSRRHSEPKRVNGKVIDI